MSELRISLNELHKTFHDKLVKHGMGEQEASKTAQIFTDNAAEGVLSHSVLRFKRLVKHMDNGGIKPGNMPKLVSSFAALERYDADFTSGVIAASFCMERACTLASEHGIAMVALGHANHWMRGGYYGHLAAKKGYVGICWTNTMPNLPSWGSAESNIGNNPFIMAVPCSDGENLVLDTSMAQYSYGKLEVTRRAGKMLPTDGGYDENGQITRDPGAIEKTRRPLPMGFWKGSSMAILLDAAATLLSDGDNTTNVRTYMQNNGFDECDMSQVFIAIDPKALGPNRFDELSRSIKDSIHNTKKVVEGSACRYPGENAGLCRQAAERDGVLVSEAAWQDILSL